VQISAPQEIFPCGADRLYFLRKHGPHPGAGGVHEGEGEEGKAFASVLWQLNKGLGLR
jgi:hypothetical protein